MTESIYDRRIAQQIAQYADTVNMHDLPEIFHVYSHEFILPGLEKVFAVKSIQEMFASAFLEARQRTDGEGCILSIGSGDGTVEMDTAQLLLDRGVTDFRIVCADLSPILLGNLVRAAETRGLTRYLQTVEADLNRIEVPGSFDMVMANHSLHHIEGLEGLFSYVHETLKDGGIFAINDMIGRNGHMRWPETAAVVRAIWPMLSTEQRFHVQLQRYSDDFQDHDCSTEGFEGIRAQDILPLLMETFFPYKFHGAGGFIDLIVDRGYGHAYQVTNAEHVAFIRSLSQLNEIMLDAGLIKPTLMLAYFTKDRREEIFYKNRNAGSAVRTQDLNPDWTRFYDEPRKD